MSLEIETGERVEALRSAMGWSQSDLARRMVTAGWDAYSQMTVSRTEKGRRSIGLHEAISLADLFGVTVHQLAGANDTPAVDVLAGLREAVYILTEELERRQA